MAEQSAMPGFLFIHGAGGTAAKWRRTTPGLTGVPWLAVDLPGHGEAGKAEDTLSQISIEWYAESLDSRIAEEVIVVGHSMGGLIALELAARSPKVTGVILAASHVRLPVHPKILAQLAAGEFPESLFRASYGRTVDAALLEEERKELALHPAAVTYADFLSCDQYRQGPHRLQHLTVPVLAVYGAEDRLLPPGAKEELRQLRPDAQAVTIEGAGHYVMLEQPQAFLAAILHFRENLGRA